MSTSLRRDRPRARLNQAIDAADHGGFSGTGRPDQRHHLAVGHIDIDALKRKVACAIALDQTLDAQHASPSGRASYLQLYFTPLAASILRMTLNLSCK